MIRSRRLTVRLLADWLVEQVLNGSDGTYRLRLWRESRPALAALETELRLYFDEAFQDARQRLRHGFEDSLSPFDDEVLDPAANYPALLHRITLQGYLGEILAVVAVEHWGAHGHSDWRVPAFLFRFHEQEFQHLELINERLRAGQIYDPDEEAERRPGRTGDDGIAFRIDENNEITDVLTIEAKCLTRNHPAKIEEAHKKLAAGGRLPPGIRELINLLHDYETPAANVWREALLRLRQEGYLTTRRWDAVAYLCGTIPQRGERISWMPVGQPHPAYTVSRNLEGLEFQFSDLGGLITTIYRMDGNAN
jgi:hypothetical protein